MKKKTKVETWAEQLEKANSLATELNDRCNHLQKIVASRSADALRHSFENVEKMRQLNIELDEQCDRKKIYRTLSIIALVLVIFVSVIR